MRIEPETDTPRTDEQHKQFPMGGFTLDFARQLERELAEAQGQISDMDIRHAATMFHAQSVVDDAIKLREQRDMLVSALSFYAEHMKLGCDITDSGQVAKEALAAVKGKKP
jgi:hypothetical protein